MAVVFLSKKGGGKQGSNFILPLETYVAFISHETQHSRHGDDVGESYPTSARVPTKVFVTVSPHV